MQSLRVLIFQLEAAIAVDDLEGFARAFVSLVGQIGVKPARAIAAALIAERRSGLCVIGGPTPVSCA